MYSLIRLLGLTLLAFPSSEAGAHSSGDGTITSIQLEHSFDMNTFSPRAPIQLTTTSGASETDVFAVHAKIEGDNLIPIELIPNLKDLLAKKGMYRIRLKSSIHNDVNTYISTAIPICALQKSGFREEIILHRDLHGNFIGMSYSSPVIALPRPCDPHAVIFLN